MTERAMAIEVDPYRYTTIGLRVDLTYRSNNSHTSSNNATEATKSFEQSYRLNVKGLVVNPDLMTYKADFEFVDSDTSGTSGDSHTRLNKYELGSTILRKSRIPLTLAASRSVSDSSYGGEAIQDNYGIDWYLKFRTLPWIRLTYDKTKNQASGIDQDIEVSKIAISKSKGPTSNSLTYTLTDTADNISDYDSHNRVLDVRNDTRLPLNTNFNIGMVRSDFYDDSQESNQTAGSVGLNSEPVAGFREKFNYTLTDSAGDAGDGTGNDSVYESFKGRLEYYQVKNLDILMDYQKLQNESSQSYADLSEYGTNSGSDKFAGRLNYAPSTKLRMYADVQKSLTEDLVSDTDMSEYSYSSGSDSVSGGMFYRPQKNLKMFTSVSSSVSETSSSTAGDSMSKSTSFSTGANHTQTITSELSATESISYAKEEANLGDPLTGKTGRAVSDANATLNYAKKLSWSALSAGVLLGLHQETVDPGEGGEGVNYGYNAGLSGIRLRHFTLASNYNYNSIYTTYGDVYSNEQTFSSNAVGSHTTHLPMTASYSYHIMDSYLDGESVVDNTFEATAGMLYIQKLPVTTSYRRYTLVRPDSIPPELQYLYIKEKTEDKVEATVRLLHLKWLPVNASYSHYRLAQPYEMPVSLSADQQYIHTIEQVEDAVSLDASLIYFRNTSVSAFAKYSSHKLYTYNTYLGLFEKDAYKKRNMGISGSHNRSLLRGRFSLSTGYQVTTTEYITQDTREYYSVINLNGTFDKRMSRNMMLKLAAGQSFSDTDGVLDSQLTGQVNIFYKLKAWFFSAEYQHSVKKRDSDEDNTVTEDKIMLKASRSFVRII